MVIKYFYHRPDNMVDSVREVSPLNLMMKTDHFDPLFILNSCCNLIGWRFESKQIILIHPRIQFVNKSTETNNHSVKTLNQCTLNAVTVSCVDLTTKTTNPWKTGERYCSFGPPYFIRSFWFLEHFDDVISLNDMFIQRGEGQSHSPTLTPTLAHPNIHKNHTLRHFSSLMLSVWYPHNTVIVNYNENTQKEKWKSVLLPREYA